MVTKLPTECFFKIFNNLQDDYKSLYSCLLVSRLWCRIIIPILWSKIDKLNDIRLINICLLTLTAEEQSLLIPFKFHLPTYQKPLFNYTSYITSIDANDLYDRNIRWLKYNGYKVYTGKKVCH